ncbi:MAG: DNA-binding protein WhiA [Eubacteriales bacterium]|nr:DNA-binding protein WhiA [Eubacteriales bacterium]MDD4583449.1 DNA-binding protein WhiA [Eubacteriales bacterium]
MSFSSDVKNELARFETDKKCCMLAEIAGFIRMCGSIILSGSGRLDLKLTTENPAIARLFLKRIKSYFGVGAELQIGQNTLLKRGHVYEMIIGAESKAEQILRETGILRVKEGCNYFPDTISYDLVKTKCCKKAYIRGAFMGAGTISDPEKGYHLELVCTSEILANDLRRLVNSFGMKTKVVQRKNNYVVYIKEGEQISDFLALLGAHNHVLEFENIRIIKDLRNRTNRIVNCESANLDKTINSAVKQTSAIRLIDSKRGLDSLPEKLREVARLRLENPEASLAELAEMLDPPLKKSGINHRFKKIQEIAEKL